MKIGIYIPKKRPTSYKIVQENICNNFDKNFVEIIEFNNTKNIPQQADIIWNPNVGGGFISEIRKEHTNKPIVITLHGARLFALKINELKNKNLSSLRIIRHRQQQKKLWKKHKHDFEKIITVSEYSKKELVKFLNLEPNSIIPVYNALNHDEFKPKGDKKDYFLHISEYQPVKNLDRIIKAYLQAIKETDLPDFWIVSRNFPRKNIHDKIKILENRYRTNQEIVELYQNAFGFLFPSLHEGFGLPIIEAMACGTPVITSNITACPEVAANAALTVNPKNTADLKNAIIKLATNNKLYVNLKQKGIQRAKFFSWEKAAKKYFEIFTQL